MLKVNALHSTFKHSATDVDSRWPSTVNDEWVTYLATITTIFGELCKGKRPSPRAALSDTGSRRLPPPSLAVFPQLRGVCSQTSSTQLNFGKLTTPKLKLFKTCRHTYATPKWCRERERRLGQGRATNFDDKVAYFKRALQRSLTTSAISQVIRLLPPRHFRQTPMLLRMVLTHNMNQNPKFLIKLIAPTCLRKLTLLN